METTNEVNVKECDENAEEVLPLTVDEKDLPKIIAGQVTKLKELKESVDKAIRDAQNSIESAEDAQGFKSYFVVGTDKKDAIERLQKAVESIAESQLSFADAQKVTFDYQENIGQITRYLFALGVSNIAANRTVVTQLKMQLEGASQSEISELARREIINVIKQLKAQEDIIEKQSEMADKINEHTNQIKYLITIDDCEEKIENSIKESKEVIDEKFEKLEKQYTASKLQQSEELRICRQDYGNIREEIEREKKLLGDFNTILNKKSSKTIVLIIGIISIISLGVSLFNLFR